jgi:hypothetical protein
VKDKLQHLVRISWMDSCDMPSRIHLTADGIDTVCGGHSEYIAHRRLAQSPRKDHGRSRYCQRCFANGGKSLPWDSRCIDANARHHTEALADSVQDDVRQEGAGK